jgi:DNA-binding NarL/FixJ family response regulator
MTVNPPYPPIRVLLVDSHQVVRQGLRLLIEAEGFTVVGESGHGAEAVELCARTAPDVVLVDPTLPDLEGVELLNALREGTPRARVIVLTTDIDQRRVRGLLAAGARGYLLKHIDSKGLVAAIRNAVAGRYSIEPSAASLLAVPPAPDDSGLTPRERQVLSLVARGLTNKVIARELKISAGTVRVYLSEILVKLGAANRTEAAMIGVQRGLVEQAGQKTYRSY